MCAWNWAKIRKALSSLKNEKGRTRLQDLPADVFLKIILRLDSVSLYRLAHTSRSLRSLAIQNTEAWEVFKLDPHTKISNFPFALLGFLISSNLHSVVQTAHFDHTSIKITDLELILKHLPNLTYLSLVNCLTIDCWKILSLLKAAGKTDGSGFLKRLTRLDIRGNFPSERNQQSHGHEMYCYGEIKKVLLAFGDKHNDLPRPLPWQALSESHYALYHFWHLLRSRRMMAPPLLNDAFALDDPSDARNNLPPLDEFRPAWLPDTLVHFIQVTETNDPDAPVKIDLESCRLCHKNVAVQGALTSCQACGTTTSVSCVLCMCLRCEGVLCVSCYRRGYRLLNGVTEADPSLVPQALSWRTIRCRQCLFSRYICSDPACQREYKSDSRWSCPSCCQQRTRWNPLSRPAPVNNTPILTPPITIEYLRWFPD